MEDEISLIDYLRVLVRRRRLILGGTAIVTVFSIFFSLMLPKGYESRTRVLVVTKQKFRIKSDSKYITQEPELDINTQLELFGSREMARRVVKGLGLDREDPPMTAEAVLASGRLKRIGATFVIELTVSASSPDRSRDIASRWAAEFIKYNEEVYSNDNKDFSRHLRKNLEEVKSKLSLQKKKFSSFLGSSQKIPEDIISGKEGIIIELQQKKSSLSESLDLFIASYQDSWNLLLDETLSSIRRELASLKKRESDGTQSIEAMNESLKSTPGKNRSQPVQIRIPLTEQSPGLKSGAKKPAPEMFLTTSKDPVVVKLKLDIIAATLANRQIRRDIKSLENSLPGIEALFSDIRRVKIDDMEAGAIIQLISALRERLTPYAFIGDTMDIEYIFEEMSNYMSERKMFKKVLAHLKSHYTEYQDTLLKSKSYELEFETLESDYLALLDTYEALGQKIGEYNLKAGVSDGKVKLIEPAIMPDGPSTPVKRKIVITWFIASLLLFVFLGFLLDYYQREARNINESAT